MTSTARITAFWNSYVSSLPEGITPPSNVYTSWHFGSTEALANELGELARDGIKTATCGLLWEYEVEHEALPKTGDLSVVTNWAEEPLCIIETTEVNVVAFHQVDAQFAFDEGEGDCSLAFWRKVHWDVFSMVCAEIGQEPAEDMPLVCERFRVIFPG